MNCKTVEELLPLYAGGDLDLERATLVDVHLQTCAACTKAANEYREVFQLTQQFAPPVFSEGVYAGLRQRVLREIETKERAPAWTPMIAGLFRPRLSWAIAGVLLIAFLLLALNLVVKRGSHQKDLAILPSSNQRSDPPAGRHTALPSPAKKPEQSLAVAHPHGSKQRRNPVGIRVNDGIARQDQLAARKQVSPRPLSEPGAFTPLETNASGKTLRVEIQTKDPNIRIIWFSEQETKPGT